MQAIPATVNADRRRGSGILLPVAIDLASGNFAGRDYTSAAASEDPREIMLVHPDLAATRAALAEGRLGEVLAPLERAVRVETRDADHWRVLAEFASRIGDDDLALSAARRLRELQPREITHRMLEMRLLAETGAVPEALRIARRLEAEAPTDARLALLAGTYLAQLGRFDEAIAALHRAVRRAPDSALAWEALANLKVFEAQDPDLASLEQATARAGDVPENAALSYAFAKACDDLGDTARAYTWFTRGARQVLRGRTPRIDGLLAQAAAVREAFPPSRLAANAGNGRPERPVLIIGCPRSGTTLLERILAASPEVSPGGELKMLRLACLAFTPPAPARVEAFVQASGGEAEAWSRVAETYVRRLVRRFGRADGVVDKGLVNYLYVGALALALPGARIIHVRRDPMDVAWSCFRRRFHDGLAWSYDFGSIAAFIRAYEDMAAYWTGVLPGRVLPVEFEDLIGDPDAGTARVFAFLGIERPADWRSFNEKAGAVHTSSQIQVRRPLNTDGLRAWRRYESHLAPLRDALGRQGLLERMRP